MGKKEHKEQFDKFLSTVKELKLAIVTHTKADVDSLSSAYALSRAIPNSVLCVADEMNEGATALAERLNVQPIELSKIDRNNFDGLVIADTSAYAMLPQAKGWKILLIVDHHRVDGRDMNSEYMILEPESPSTAEIIANMVEDIDAKIAFALSVGIIADGARFKTARTETFETLARLMHIADGNYSEMLGFAEPEPKHESKVAVLSGMKNLEFIYSAGYLIATTEVKSNESDMSSIITEAADVAFTAKWKDENKETRISARARKDVKIPLNEVMGKVAKELGGAGGGHPKAAGAALKAHTKESLKKCVDTFIEMAE